MSKDGEGAPMWTAEGIVTPLSDERYDLVKDHHLFKQHIEKGFLKVLTSDVTGNHKEVKKQTASMAKRDGFAQLTPATIGIHTAVKISNQSIDSDMQFRK
jgi:hypothetical protein